MSNLSNKDGYIVLAEDNPADVYLVREALEEQQIGCDLEVFFDGEQTSEFFTKLDASSSYSCPRLLLLDLHLPKRDGEGTLKHLSERCGQTPVVVLASSSSPRDYETVSRHAALYYFQKPSSLEQFMNGGSAKAHNTQ